MQSTDLQVLTNLAPVAKAQLEAAGFKVDMQSMDWQTLVGRRVKKDPPDKGGWNAFLTSWVAADILNPVMAGFFNASCDKAMFGWPCDETDREDARPVRQGDRPGQAEGRSSRTCRSTGSTIRRTSISASGTRRIADAHHHRRQRDGAGAGVLERHEEVVAYRGRPDRGTGLPRRFGTTGGASMKTMRRTLAALAAGAVAGTVLAGAGRRWPRARS